MGRIRTLLVDDERGARQGLRLLLGCEPLLEVVGEASNGVAAVELTASLAPDLVLMDLHMPGGDGLDAARVIARVAPGTVVVMLSLNDSETLQAAATGAGARAFLPKHRIADELVPLIQALFKEADGVSPI